MRKLSVVINFLNKYYFGWFSCLRAFHPFLKGNKIIKEEGGLFKNNRNYPKAL